MNFLRALDMECMLGLEEVCQDIFLLLNSIIL